MIYLYIGGDFMYNYDNFENPEPIRSVSTTNSFLTNTFFRMFLGLLASVAAALYAYYSGFSVSMVDSGAYSILAFAELAVVLIFSLLFKKLSPTAVTVLFFGYAFLNGLTLSTIFAIFSLESIGITFAATALLFGSLAFLGYKTDKDISNWGTILTVTLLIGLILTVFNLFIGNTMLDVFLDWGILFIFFGLTVYDMNKLNAMYESGFCDDEKFYIYGAMELYLDFINIFIRILSLLGKSKD